MRGSAIWFANEIKRGNYADIDLIFTSDMTSVADLRALCKLNVPIICYFHENQLTYPVPDEAERDYQYGFTNITSCLAADEVWFNSDYHRESFTQAAGELLRKMPDFVPEGVVERIKGASRVMPLGLNDNLFDLPKNRTAGAPVILWNHRWEYDKNPDEFFEVLFDLDRAGVDFRLIAAGEQFRTHPPIFDAAEKMLADKIVHFGYAPGAANYYNLLAQSDIVVSTAVHEFFGLAVMEAVAAECRPVLPNRLSYPELIPANLHHKILYDNHEQLRQRLADLCERGVAELPGELSQKVRQLRWSRLIDLYDERFSRTVRAK